MAALVLAAYAIAALVAVCVGTWLVMGIAAELLAARADIVRRAAPPAPKLPRARALRPRR